jgi:hypothetical protein
MELNQSKKQNLRSFSTFLLHTHLKLLLMMKAKGWERITVFPRVYPLIFVGQCCQPLANFFVVAGSWEEK